MLTVTAKAASLSILTLQNRGYLHIVHMAYRHQLRYRNERMLRINAIHETLQRYNGRLYWSEQLF